MNEIIHQSLQWDCGECRVDIITSFSQRGKKSRIRDGLRFAQSGGVKFFPSTPISHSFWDRSWRLRILFFFLSYTVREDWKSEIDGRNGEKTFKKEGTISAKSQMLNILGSGNHSIKLIRARGNLDHLIQVLYFVDAETDPEREVALSTGSGLVNVTGISWEQAFAHIYFTAFL